MATLRVRDRLVMATPESDFVPIFDAEPQAEPAPAKNRGNRRRGKTKGYARQKGGAHQMGWRSDTVILGRISLVRSLLAQGYSTAQMLPVVNQYMTANNEPSISLDTVFDDRVRLRELREDERAANEANAETTLQAHIAALTEVQMQAWRSFHDTEDRSLNKSAYLSVIRAAIEAMARLDGSLAPAKLQITTDSEEMRRFQNAIEIEVPDPEARKRLALRIIRGDATEAG